MATLAMTRHILMRNGIAVPQVVARCCEEQDAGHEIDDQADRDGTEDPAEGGQGNVSADAEQTQVEHPARADQHRHSHCVKRQHGRLSPHRGRLTHPYRERTRFEPDQHTHGGVSDGVSVYVGSSQIGYSLRVRGLLGGLIP